MTVRRSKKWNFINVINYWHPPCKWSPISFSHWQCPLDEDFTFPRFVGLLILSLWSKQRYYDFLHFVPLATILTHIFRIFYFHQIPHTRSPVSATMKLAKTKKYKKIPLPLYLQRCHREIAHITPLTFSQNDEGTTANVAVDKMYYQQQFRL
jgi:hypothetical protein